MNIRLALINEDEKIDRCGITWEPTKTEDNWKQMEGKATIWSKGKIGKIATFEHWLKGLNFTH